MQYAHVSAFRLQIWRDERWRVVLSASSLSHAERLRGLLAEYAVDARISSDPRPVWRWSGTGRVEVRAMPLSEGFALPIEKLAVVTEEEIFGPRQKRRRRPVSWPDSAAVDRMRLRLGERLIEGERDAPPPREAPPPRLPPPRPPGPRASVSE